MTKTQRLERANTLLNVIANCGCRFFWHKGRVSQLERDARGKVWFVDAWSGKRVYTHYSGRWRGFTQGGTLRCLVISLRKWIVSGEKMHPAILGPWPEWQCGGDLWGYGDDMIIVRGEARALMLI